MLIVQIVTGEEYQPSVWSADWCYLHPIDRTYVDEVQLNFCVLGVEAEG